MSVYLSIQFSEGLRMPYDKYVARGCYGLETKASRVLLRTKCTLECPMSSLGYWAEEMFAVAFRESE